MDALRAFDSGGSDPVPVLDLLDDYHDLVAPDKPNMRPHYWATLSQVPWRACNCAVCRAAGVETIIFRGNNRNRRRGFHNTYVFYKQLGELLSQEDPSDDGESSSPARGAKAFPMPPEARNRQKDAQRYPLFAPRDP